MVIIQTSKDGCALGLVVVAGHPVSIQGASKSKTHWKAKIAVEARKAFLSVLPDQDLVITITFFHERKPKFDTDNMCKPICDALNGIAYIDDKQLIERHARFRDLNGAFRIKGVAPEIATAIANGSEFVSVEITKLGSRIEEI